MNHGKQFLLKDFNILSTSRLEDVDSKFSQYFQSRGFSLIDKSKTPDINIALARLPYSNLFAGSFGCNIQAVLAEKAADYHLFAPIKGELLNHGEGPTSIKPGTALLIPPGHEVNITWRDDCYGVCLVTPSKIIHKRAAALFTEKSIANNSAPQYIDLTTGVGLSIANTLNTILHELEDEETLLSQGITTKAHNDLLLTALLNAIKPEAQDTVANQQPTNILRKAMAYIHSNIDQPISLNSLAKGCQTSPRTLQDHFKKHLNSTPTNIINQEKMKRIRDELLAADAKVERVADIAERFGFSHASNFSKRYKTVYGEKPSETLNTEL